MAELTAHKTAPTRMIGSFRLAHSFLMCLGSMSVVMTQATLMSFAIVCMTRSHSTYQSRDDSNVTDSNVDSSYSSNSTEFDWDKDLQGRILGASFYGLLCTQFVGGLISNRIGGGKLLAVSSAFFCSLLTLISPVVVRYSTNLFFILRLFCGAGFGLFIPSQMPLLVQWCVPAEQGFLVGLAFAGFSLASMVNNPMSGFLCKHFGWSSTFYVNGSIALAWSITAIFLVHDSPDKHPLISEAEKSYIISNRPNRVQMKKPPVPWKGILTSVPIWAVIFTTLFYFAGHMSILIFQPTYMREVLHFDVEQNGIMSAIPGICSLFTHFLVGPFFDCIRATNRFSLTATRKMFNSFGLFFPALILVALSQLPSSFKYVAVALISLSLVGTEFAICGGFGYAILDMAPQYTGVIEGMKATVSNTPGFFMPLIISHITRNGSSEEWSYVMLILAGSYTIGGLLFLFFSSSELQSWAVTDKSAMKMQHMEDAPLKIGLFPEDM